MCLIVWLLYYSKTWKRVVGDGACLSMMYWKARWEETIQCQPKILSMMGNRTNVPRMPDISRNEDKLKIMGI